MKIRELVSEMEKMEEEKNFPLELRKEWRKKILVLLKEQYHKQKQLLKAYTKVKSKKFASERFLLG